MPGTVYFIFLLANKVLDCIIGLYLCYNKSTESVNMQNSCAHELNKTLFLLWFKRCLWFWTSIWHLKNRVLDSFIIDSFPLFIFKIILFFEKICIVRFQFKTHILMIKFKSQIQKHLFLFKTHFQVSYFFKIHLQVS